MYTYQPNKKPRAVFTNSDVALLLELVETHKTVILSADGRPMTQIKLSEWETITREFNARTTGDPKSMDCLRIKHKNIKQDRGNKGPFRGAVKVDEQQIFNMYESDSMSNEPHIVLEVDDDEVIEQPTKPNNARSSQNNSNNARDSWDSSSIARLQKRKLELEVQHLELQVEKDKLTIQLLRRKLGKGQRFG